MAYDKSRDSFQHAIDLVKFVRRFNESGAHPDRRGFGIGVAGFPEGHPATPNRLVEMDYFKAKVDAGADYIVTQLFFDNRDFLDFRERCALARRSHPDYRRHHADYLHRRTETHGRSGWRRTLSLRSYYVLCSLAKMIPRWSGALAFNTHWNNAMILWLMMLPVFISTRSTGRTLPG
jgi:hypothetical protein